ncbi:MAG: hypothetical protein AAGC68_02545, partial [Verrucomicrobiota bacterium]
MREENNLGFRCLFGDPERSAVWAAAYPIESEGSVQIHPDRITLLLSKEDQFIIDRDQNRATSLAGHSGIAIVFERSVFQATLESFRPGLHPVIRSFLRDDATDTVFEPSLDLSLAERLFSDFLTPPLSGPSLPFFFEAKIKEVIAFTCFGEGDVKGEFFCSRQKRISSERVAKATA